VKPYSTLDNPIIVPIQQFAYEWAADYIRRGERVLDVGFGLGYGISILFEKTPIVDGVEIDPRAVDHAQQQLAYRAHRLLRYDGVHLPFPDATYNVLTCIDVLEHVPDYRAFIAEMLRVARRAVVISTPHRRAENTNADGTPTNYHHLREWTYPELALILKDYDVQWQFINRVNEVHNIGAYGADTQALLPIIKRG
jgi:ubiquinone/menaquinone biosynthesis C-methylase UbiE